VEVQDTAPWEAKEKPAPKHNAEPNKNTPVTFAKSEVHPIEKAANGAWSPDTLWKKLLERLYEEDRMLQVIAMSGKARSITDNTLTVLFDSEPKLKAVQKTQNAALISEILKTLAPDMKLMTAFGAQNDDLSEQMKSLFGDGVEIVD
jgi:hypothetical protein